MRHTSYISQLFFAFIVSLTIVTSFSNHKTTGPLVMAIPEVIEDAVNVIKSRTKDAIEPICEKYDELPSQGKFGAGVVGGYTVTKLSVRTTVKAAKYTGAAFILSEVLNQAGILDHVSEDGEEIMLKARQKVTGVVNDCRLAVRKHLSYEKFRSCYEECMKKDKMGTLGFTTGAVASLVL